MSIRSKVGMSHSEMVKTFMEIFDQPINTKYDFDDRKLEQFRLNLIKEEINELKDAILKHNMIEMVDALADILFVVYGAGHTFGIDLSHIQSEFYNAYRSINSDLEPVMAKQIILLDEYCRLLETKLNSNSLVSEVTSDKTHKKMFVKMYLETIISICYYLAILFAIDINIIFKIVYDSNMTKFCDTSDDAEETIKHYKKTKPDLKIGYKIKETYKRIYIVYNMETGKVMKNYKWSPPDKAIAEYIWETFLIKNVKIISHANPEEDDHSDEWQTIKFEEL